MPTFSVLVPCYNYGEFVTETVESVIAQTDEDWELILVDDCSTDNTWEIITGFDHPRIRALRHDTNQGSSAAFNTALTVATGDWICNLDSDDRYLPTFLQRQREFLTAHPEIDVSGTWLRQIDREGRPADGTYEQWFNQDWDLNDPEVWVWQNPLCHNSTVVRRSLQERVGGMRTEIVIAPDWDKWVMMLAAGARFGLIPEILVESRLHGTNISLQGSPQVLRDWSLITAGSAAQWWRSLGRDDLVARNLAHFLRDDLVTELTPEEIAQILGDATGIDPQQLAELSAGLAVAAAGNQSEREQWRDSVSSYASHVESLLEDHRILSERISDLQAELASASADLAETQHQLQAIQESRSYRVARTVRRILP